MFHGIPKMTEDNQSALEQADEFNITVIKNKIYFYEEINDKTILSLITKIEMMNTRLLQMKVDYGLSKPPKIYLHIQSYGGDVFAGLSALSKIENNEVPIVTIVDGFVASAATLVFLGGKKRQMQRNAHFLIHQVRGEFWGKHDELKDEYKNSKSLMKIIKKIYKNKSNLDTKTINAIISKERYLNAEECKQYELVDEIL